MEKQVAISKDDIVIIKNQFFPKSATQAEIEYCLCVAKALNLNPIKKEIFFLERKSQQNGVWTSKIEPLVGRDGFLSIAHQSGKFGGMKTTSFLKEVPKMIDGEWELKKDLIATCEVHRTDSSNSFLVEVAYSEYAQKTREGLFTKFWAEKPETMLKKVAESQALRKAFNISGVYAIEEINDINITEVETEAIDVDVTETQEALKQLGLSTTEKNGWLKIEGETYGKEQKLNALGFVLKKCSNGSFFIKKVT